MLKRITLAALIVLSPVGTVSVVSLHGNLAHAGTIPATPSWFEIPSTKLRSVCPPNNFGGSSYAFTDNCWAVTAAWNSAVFDTTRNRLIIWGGGHADYLGNEVYALNLNSLTIQRLTDPGLPLATSGCPESLVNGTQPNSRHTYDGIAYMPNVDRMFVFGGSLSQCGFLGNGTWTLNLATLQWQNMNPSGTIPKPVPGIVTAYDPNTGRVFLHDDFFLYSYTFSTNSYQQLSGANAIDFQLTAVIDPKRKKFVIIGNGQEWIYDIGPGSTFTRQPLNTTGGSAIVNSLYPGLAYDPVTDRIVAWNGGNTVYSLNLDTRVWATTTFSGGPGAALANGTFERWSYSPASGVFVVINSVDSNAFTLRLTSGDTIPPATPTGLQVK